LMKRIIFSIVVALIMVLVLLPNAVLEASLPEKEVSGAFTVGHASPSVNSVKLYNSAGTTEVTSMTPQTQYMFKVDVTSPHGMNHLKFLRVIVFYYAGTPKFPGPQVLLVSNATSGQLNVVVNNVSDFVIGNNVRIADTLSGEYNTIASIAGTTLTMTTNLTNSYATANRATVTNFYDQPTTPDSQTLANFNWDLITNTWSANYPSTHGATTWSIGTFTKPTVLTDSNFVFTGQFTPGKVARAGNWYIRVRTSDDENFEARGNTSSITMNTYDEIVLGTGSLDWGGVPVGLDYATSPNPLPVTLTYIANGNYNKYVSSSNWAGGTYTAYLEPSGTPTVQDRFSLKAVIGSNTHFVQAVDGSHAYGTTMDVTGTQTYEEGDAPVASMSLKLFTSFQADTYQGLITYYITTR